MTTTRRPDHVLDRGGVRTPGAPGRVEQAFADLEKRGEFDRWQHLDPDDANFRARFGTDALAGLDGLALLERMHKREGQNCLMYWLEFKNDDELPALFGSIGGGSALKFGIYQKAATGKWMVSGQGHSGVENLVEEAIDYARAQRDQLLEGCGRLESGGATHPMPTTSRSKSTSADICRSSATGPGPHKYFHLVFPDKIDDFHISTLSYTLPSAAIAFMLMTGDDQIKFNTLERLTGLGVTVDGGLGDDTLIGPDTYNQWDVNGPGQGLLNNVVEFLEIERLEGSAHVDHLTGPPNILPTVEQPAESNTYLWVINAEKAGYLYNPSTNETFITFSEMEQLTGQNGTSNTFLVEAAGSIEQVNGGTDPLGGFDYLIVVLDNTPDIFVIPNSSGSGSVTTTETTARTIAYTGLDDLVKQTTTTVTIDGTNSADTIGISDYVGDGNAQGQTGYHMMQMSMAGRQFLIDGVLSDYYIFTLPTESLIVKGHSGADTITIYSLDPNFGLIGAPGTETMLGIYGNEDGAPELFPDLAYDEVIFAGDIYTNGAYLEVFAETIKQADNVTVSTYKSMIWVMGMPSPGGRARLVPPSWRTFHL